MSLGNPGRLARAFPRFPELKLTMNVAPRLAMAAATALFVSLSWSAPAFATTLKEALAGAYADNPALNAARAGVRVTDETVPMARSGMRPTIGAQGQMNHQSQSGMETFTSSFAVTINQAIFDGFRTANNVRAAEANVRASRANLLNTEQNILFSAVEAFMNVVTDRQIAVYRERNLEFLREQVRAARSRFDVGEGTRTDVSQAEASEAAAIAQLAAARAQVQASEASYRQVVGDAPARLSRAEPERALLPATLDAALALSFRHHPAIHATQHLVDAASFAVKADEGAMLPSLSATADVSTSHTDISGLPGVGMGAETGTRNSASVGLNLTVPIYQGGGASAQVRQSKEELGQARIELDVAREQVRLAATSAWSQYVAAGQAVAANRELVAAAQLALDGVIEERGVGQRTTLDVLNAQADLIGAQIDLASSERAVVVASYAILLAVGHLNAARLGLPVALHDPGEHYRAVRDSWGGTRTPDGR